MSLQQLKSVIQAANPEILELKFGCELDGDVTFISVNPKTNEYYVLAGNKILKRSEYRKILGRPITIADIILAIKTKYVFSSDLTDENNAILELLMPVYNYGKLVHDQYWDLANDSLDAQSPETIQFLINLLCK